MTWFEKPPATVGVVLTGITSQLLFRIVPVIASLNAGRVGTLVVSQPVLRKLAGAPTRNRG